MGLQLDWENPISGEGLFAEVRQSLLTQDPQNGEWVRPGQGLMPASFLIINQQEIKADFGQRAIGRHHEHRPIIVATAAARSRAVEITVTAQRQCGFRIHPVGAVE